MPRLAPVTRATAPSILRAFIVSSFLVGLTGLPAVAVVPVMVPYRAHRVRQVLLVPPERRQVEVVVRADQEIQAPRVRRIRVQHVVAVTQEDAEPGRLRFGEPRRGARAAARRA